LFGFAERERLKAFYNPAQGVALGQGVCYGCSLAEVKRVPFRRIIILSAKNNS
jgi:hypothetical protein